MPMKATKQTAVTGSPQCVIRAYHTAVYTSTCNNQSETSVADSWHMEIPS